MEADCLSDRSRDFDFFCKKERRLFITEYKKLTVGKFFAAKMSKHKNFKGVIAILPPFCLF